MGKRQGPAALQDADATVQRASEVAIDRGPDESGPLSDFVYTVERSILPTMAAPNDKIRKRILISLLVVLALGVVWVYSGVQYRSVSGEPMSQIKIGPDGVPRWNGISLADTNNQAIVFKFLKLRHLKAFVYVANQHGIPATNQTAFNNMTAAIRNAGLAPNLPNK